MGEQPQPQGLLSGLMNIGPLAGLNIIPQISQKEIVIELTTQQLLDMLLEKADPRAKACTTLELHEGKLQLKIRLM